VCLLERRGLSLGREGLKVVEVLTTESGMREDMSDEAENRTIICSSLKCSLKIKNNEIVQYVFGC